MQHVIITVSLCLIILVSRAQQDPTPDQRAAQKSVIEFFEGLSHTDIKKIRSTCTDDVIILETGFIWNFDSLALRLQKKKPADFKRINQLDFLQTHIKKDVAWLYYWNKATITANNKKVEVKWLESAVLKKDKTGWKIQLLHSTEIERQQ
jgi:ketosteroid isomerase-like protein